MLISYVFVDYNVRNLMYVLFVCVCEMNTVFVFI